MAALADLTWAENDKLTEDELNRRARAIHDRLTALEAFVPEWEAQVAALVGVGLDRINTALMPAYQTILGLAQLGALFTATSTTSVIVGTGTKLFIVGANEGDRILFAPTATIGVTRVDDPSVAMVGSLISYDRTSGALEISVDEATGSGTHAAWTITPAVPAAMLTELASAVVLAGDNTWSGDQAFAGAVSFDGAAVSMATAARNAFRTALGLGTAAYTAGSNYAPASSVIGDAEPGSIFGRAVGTGPGPLAALSATNAAAVIAAAGRFLESAGGTLEGPLSFPGGGSQAYGAKIQRFSGADGDTNISTHGDGALRFLVLDNGGIIFSTANTRRLRIDTTGDVIADGWMMAEAFRTGLVTIANNAVFNFSPPSSWGILTVSSSDARIACAIGFRVTASPDTRMIAAPTGGNIVDLATGGQTGTTGTDGRFRVSAIADGRLSLENRTGAALNIGYTVRN